MDLDSLTDKDFLDIVRWIRPHTIDDKDFDKINNNINERCKRLGYTFDWGCCGSNIIHAIKE